MVQTRRKKQKGKKQLANLAKQGQKLKKRKIHSSDPYAPQGTTT